MIALQMDLFDDPEQREILELKRFVIEVQESTGKVRRSLFAKNDELKKRCSGLEERMYLLEQQIQIISKVI